jgi:Cu-processing system ATP-binding protein
MLQVTDLHKKYGRKHVLLGIDLTISEPGIYAILGPNGSGKTTILKSVLGMVIPDRGKVEFNGINTKKDNEYRKNIDYVPQIAHFPQNIRVYEMLTLIAKIRGTQPVRKRELIDMFRLTSNLDQRIGALSGGNLQKLNLTMSLMFDSDTIILDEPTSGLDPIALIALKELLRKEVLRGKTIILTTHIMNLVEELATDITFILDGKIYYKGPMDELKHQHGDTDMEHVMANIMIKHA